MGNDREWDSFAKYLAHGQEPISLARLEKQHPWLEEIGDKRRSNKYRDDLNWLLSRAWNYKSADELMKAYDDENQGLILTEDARNEHESIPDEDRTFIMSILAKAMSENDRINDSVRKEELRKVVEQ